MNLRALRLIVTSDPNLFEHHLNRAGLTIVGFVDRDPLRKQLQSESVYNIAAQLTDDIDIGVTMTRAQKQLQELAESAGYLVSLIEGLDQMPGTLPNPIKSMLNAGDEEEEAPEPEGEEGAPPGDPGAGGPPPGPGGPPPGGGMPPGMPPV